MTSHLPKSDYGQMCKIAKNSGALHDLICVFSNMLTDIRMILTDWYEP